MLYHALGSHRSKRRKANEQARFKCCTVPLTDIIVHTKSRRGLQPRVPRPVTSTSPQTDPLSSCPIFFTDLACIVEMQDISDISICVGLSGLKRLRRTISTAVYKAGADIRVTTPLVVALQYLGQEKYEFGRQGSQPLCESFESGSQI